jgi:hypothetical protein
MPITTIRCRHSSSFSTSPFRSPPATFWLTKQQFGRTNNKPQFHLGRTECPVVSSVRRTISRMGRTMSVTDRYFKAWEIRPRSQRWKICNHCATNTSNCSVFRVFLQLLWIPVARLESREPKVDHWRVSYRPSSSNTTCICHIVQRSIWIIENRIFFKVRLSSEMRVTFHIGRLIISQKKGKLSYPGSLKVYYDTGWNSLINDLFTF